MAPRAYWKGYLKLSLVSCPIALFPANSEREKISFHQLNKKTGHRVKYRKVDAESGDEVGFGGYHQRVRGSARATTSSLTPRSSMRLRSRASAQSPSTNLCLGTIDELYLNSPYYIAPDGEVGCRHLQSFARKAWWRLAVFTSREHIIALEARGKALLGISAARSRHQVHQSFRAIIVSG